MYIENQNRESECFRGKWACSRSNKVVICGRHKVSHASVNFNGNKAKNQGAAVKPDGAVGNILTRSTFVSRNQLPAACEECRMNHYLLIYHVVEDYISRRTPFRKEHLRLALEAHHRGDLLMGGALSDPVDQAVLVFRCKDQTSVEAFIQSDPYIKNGLVRRWEIRPWTVVIG